MNWQDILIQQAITTVIAIAVDGKSKSRFRRQLLKIFQTIAAAFPNDAAFVDVMTKGAK